MKKFEKDIFIFYNLILYESLYISIKVVLFKLRNVKGKYAYMYLSTLKI